MSCYTVIMFFSRLHSILLCSASEQDNSGDQRSNTSHLRPDIVNILAQTIS